MASTFLWLNCIKILTLLAKLMVSPQVFVQFVLPLEVEIIYCLQCLKWCNGTLALLKELYMVQPFWKTTWQVLKNEIWTTMQLSWTPEHSSCRNKNLQSHKNLSVTVQSSFIPNSPKPEATSMSFRSEGLSRHPRTAWSASQQWEENIVITVGKPRVHSTAPRLFPTTPCPSAIIWR